MLKIEKYSPKRKNAWNLLVQESKNGTFLLNRDYMDYHADRFEDFSLLFYDADILLAILPANVKDGVLYSHQGLTYGGLIYANNMKATKMAEVFNLMIDFLKSHQITKLIYKAIPHIYHNSPAEEDLYFLFRLGAKLYRRDLSTTILQSNKMRFDRGRRRCIDDAKKNNFVIKKTDDFARMYEIMHDILTVKYGVKPVHSAAEMQLLSDRFPDNIHLYGCYNGDEMISGAWIFITKNVVHAQYVYSSDFGKKNGANDLMYDFLINEKFVDFRYFDFGISTEKNGQYLNEFLLQQKEMFGGRSTVYDFYELNLI